MAWKGTPESSTNNSAPNNKQFGGERSNIKKDINRSQVIKRDNDVFKDVSISLEDIDGILYKFIDEKLNLQVVDNGELIKVPIIYGTPETWTSVKKGANIRDNNGKLQLPAFMFSRKSFSNNRDLETFNRYLTYDVISQFNEKNKYTRFDILSNIIPSKPIYSVTLPKHIIVDYECLVWTDYVDQNNKIIEKINFAEKDYWGDHDRYKFRVSIDSFDNSVEEDDQTDRNVLSTFNLKVYAYLLTPDMIPSMEGIKSTTQKKYSAKKIVVNEQAVNGYQLGRIKSDIRSNSVDKSKFVDNYRFNGNQVQKLDKRSIKTTIMKDEKMVTIYKTPFHPAPSSTSQYGENGWVAYDKNYLYIYKYPIGWLRRAIVEFDYIFSEEGVRQYISGYDCNNDPIYTNVNIRPINNAFRIFQRFPDKFYQQVPLQSSDYGEDGWMSYDGEYFYIYNDNSWKRIVTTIFEQF
jgi:hypothetical protein